MSEDKPVPIWRKLFKSPTEMKEADVPMIVEHFLPPGVTFIAGPSGHGKSWLSLSLAKALFHGRPFLGHFKIEHAMPIIYLVPEVGESMVKQRLRLLGLDQIKDGFLLQTMSDGLISLANGHLKDAVKDLQPVVFLDTLARFNKTKDENQSAENQKLNDDIFNLLTVGARSVIPIHHSVKSLAGGENDPTLENVLRGTGDLGAIADAVYCVLCSDKKNFVAEVSNVKARDFNPTDSFGIQGRPYIDETQDIKLIRPPDLEKEDFDTQQSIAADNEITKDPRISVNNLTRILQVRKPRAQYLAGLAGWIQEGRIWVRKKR